MLSEYKQLLCCPDDGSDLTLEKRGLTCPRCGRRFSVFKDNFVEILPSEYPGWDLKGNRDALLKAEQSYEAIFRREFVWKEQTTGWGDLAAATPGYRAFIKEQVQWIRKHLGAYHDKTAIDVSGGVGNYSSPLSSGFKRMVHCELDGESLQTAYERSTENPIFFVRAPYLRLPFHPNTFDCVICTDTLIRGRSHEKKLLKEIIRILKNGGQAIVDFHTSRLFFRNDRICLYRREEIKTLLTESGISQFKIYPFGYAPSALVPSERLYTVIDKLFHFIVPCQRYIVTFVK